MDIKKAIKLVDKTLIGRKVISTTIHGKPEECEIILEHNFLAIKNEKREITGLTRDDKLLANEEESCIIPFPD
jgi:hypothetical protein